MQGLEEDIKEIRKQAGGKSSTRRRERKERGRTQETARINRYYVLREEIKPKKKKYAILS